MRDYAGVIGALNFLAIDPTVLQEITANDRDLALDVLCSVREALDEQTA